MNVLITAYLKKQEEKSDLLLTQAWLIAALGRAEKMPSYKDFMNKKEKKPQTEEQMLAMVKALHVALGGD